MADTNKDKKKALVKRELVPEPIRTKPKKKYVRTKDAPKIILGIFILLVLFVGALNAQSDWEFKLSELTLEKVRATNAFPQGSNTYTAIDGIIVTTYEIAIEEGYSPHDASVKALDKFYELLLAYESSISNKNLNTLYTNLETPLNHRFVLKNVVPVEVITTDNETYLGEASFSYLYSLFNVEGIWEQRSESQLESVLVTHRWVEGKMRSVAKKFIPLIEIRRITIRACD